MKEKRKYSDRAEYIKKAVTKRRKILKQKAVEYKGGKCQICGYNKFVAALEFHHLNETKKSFGISVDGSTRSWDRIRKEIEKCILVCANCHRAIHASILKIEGQGEERVQAPVKIGGNL
ncbi:MAG: HNH endonuclease [Candidatus Saganbacteria bacterium]|nr:HNH endonuclease [Candidatus Saganbacteria bacterium]